MAQEQWKPPSYATEVWQPPDYAKPVDAMEELTGISFEGKSKEQPSKISEFIKGITENPTAQKVGRFLSTGDPREGNPSHIMTGMEGSLLPEMQHPQDEGWGGYLARGAYNQLIRPLGSSTGLLGASQPGGIRPSILKENLGGRLGEIGNRLLDQPDLPGIKPQLALPPSSIAGELGPATSMPFNWGAHEDIWKGGPSRPYGGMVEATGANNPALDMQIGNVIQQRIPRMEKGYFAPNRYFGTGNLPAEQPTGKAAGFGDIINQEIPLANKDKFIELADLQRGKPESAMLEVQKKMGGGVISPAVEHVGDLLHRMNERNTWNSAGYEYVRDKVEKTLRSLKNEYGFRREFQENIRNNAEYRGVDPDKLESEINNALSNYANEHSKLPVYNEAHRLARDASVQLGKGNFEEAAQNLEALKSHLGSKDEWVKFAREGLSETKQSAFKSNYPKMQGPVQDITPVQGRNILYEMKQAKDNGQLKFSAINQVMDTVEKSVSLPPKEKINLLNELTNFSKSMMASIDVSAPLRQGLPLIHKKEWWTSLDDMFKSLVSEKNYEVLMKGIEEHPNYNLAQQSGLSITNLEKLSQREEAYMSKWAEKVPGVRASERAYIGFLDKLRMDTFNSLITSAEKSGRELTPELTKGIAKFVNTATGRGSLGSLEKAAVELNYGFFSPRLMSSRLTMLNPMYYIKADPLVRKEALKSLLAIATAGETVTQLGKLAGGTVENDPVNPDFQKVKIGNTRLDPYGGFQQYIVAANKLITGKATSSTSGKQWTMGENFVAPTRLSTVANFGRSKLSPVAGFVTDMLAGKDFAGKPLNIPKEVASKFVPILMQDLYSLYQEDPSLLPLGIPAAMGMGVQSYNK